MGHLKTTKFEKLKGLIFVMNEMNDNYYEANFGRACSGD